MWDVFICHAWEDKETVARPLAIALQKVGLKVWYDEFTLKIGDSLRRSIDYGLSKSKYGVVILSPSFFSKEWPQRELDGLVAREISSGKVILPVWYNVTRNDIEHFSPVLADRLGVSTASGLNTVLKEILRVVRPEADVPSKPGKEKKISSKTLRVISNIIKKPSESEVQDAKPVLRIMQVFMFWIIFSPFLLRCGGTTINIILNPLISLTTLAIWPISLKIAINFVLMLHIVNYIVLYFTSAVCFIFEISYPLPPGILLVLLAIVNTLAALLICYWRQVK
jgi:hypothetical protein